MAWREEDEDRFDLIITEAGLDAIGVTLDKATPLAGKAKGKQATLKEALAGIKPGTKRALLVELLSQPGGAAIADLQKTTGWLPHTVRAALTGLRKKGFAVDRERNESGQTVYSIRGA